jgi:hypothetical protein
MILNVAETYFREATLFVIPDPDPGSVSDVTANLARNQL